MDALVARRAPELRRCRGRATGRQGSDGHRRHLGRRGRHGPDDHARRSADGFLRRNSVVPIKAVADEAVALAPSVQRVLVVRRLGERAGSVPWDRDRDRWWEEAIIAARAAEDVDGGADPVEPAATDPETPYMLIYTSGTTGRPKGAVHV